jgi:hypothetical protein
MMPVSCQVAAYLALHYCCHLLLPAEQFTAAEAAILHDVLVFDCCQYLLHLIRCHLLLPAEQFTAAEVAVLDHVLGSESCKYLLLSSCCYLLLPAEQFTAAEVAVLDDVLGTDWASFSARAMQPETLARIAALDTQQQALLIDVLSKISGMTG